jgi:tape measure domain-containing protein
MADNTIWKLDLQAGNSDAILKSFENSLNVAKDRINQVVAAGQNFEKLSSFQTKAAEAAKKLEVAQASAAVALKKAQDAASNGKASAEQLALMQAKAGLAAQKVETAENSLGSAMAKVKGESDRLSSAMQEETRSAGSFANAINAIKGVLGNVATQAKAAFSGIADATSHVKSAFSSVAEFASSAGSSIVNGFKNAATGIRDFVGNFRMASSEVDTFKEKASTIHISILSSLRSAGAGFLDLASKISNVTTGIQNIIQWSINLGTALFKPIVASEQLGIAFTTLMGGSKKAAEDLIKTLNHFADVTPFEPGPVQEYAAQLIGMGIDAKQTIPIMTSLGDALFGIGHGTEAEMASVVDIIGKIRVAGKATWGDISQLQTHGIDALDAMSRATGKTKDALRDMAGKGGIPAKEAIDALTKGIEMNPLYQGGMAKQAQSLSGVLSTLTGYLKEALNTFLGLKDGMVITGSILDQLKTGFSILGTMVSNPIFQDFAEKTGQKIADVLTSVEKTTGRVINGFKDLAKSLDQASGKAFVSDLAYMGRQLSYVFGTIQSLGGNVLNAFRGHLTGASGTLSGVFAGALRIAGNGLRGVGDELHHLMSFLGSIDVNPVIDGFFKAGNSAAKFIANIDPIPVRLFFSSIQYLEMQLKRTAGIVEGTVLYLFKQLASSFDFVTGKTTAFHKSFDIVNGVLVKTRSPLQTLIGDGFFKLGAIITKVAEDVHRFGDTIDNKLKTAFQDVKKAMELPVWQKMGDVLGRLGKAALDLGGSVFSLWTTFSPIGTLFKSIGDSGLTFSGVLSSIGDIVDNYVTPAINGLNGFIKDMGPLLKPISKQLLDMFVGFGAWLKQNGPTLMDLGGKIFTGIGATIKFLLPIISNDLLPALSGIGGVVGTLTTNFLTWADSSKGLQTDLTNLWNWISQNVAPIFTSLGNIIKNDVMPHWDGFEKSTGKLTDSLGRLWDKISPILTPAIDTLGVSGVETKGKMDGMRTAIDVIGVAIDAFIKNINMAIDTLSTLIDWLSTAIGWMNQFDAGMTNVAADIINFLSGGRANAKHVNTSGSVSGGGIGGGGAVRSFASGIENFGGGLAYVHANELLLNLPKGTSVFNPAKTAQFMQGLKMPTPTFSMAAQSSSSTSQSGNNDQVVGLLAAILDALQKQGRGGNVTMNANVASGSVDAQRINQMIQSLGGKAAEMMQRGGG